MKKYNILFAIAILAFLTVSCDEVLNTSSNSDIAKQLEGQWKCDETSTLYKSASAFKSVERIYYVNIFLSDKDSTTVQIEKFYELGENVIAHAKVNGNNITLIKEELEGGFSIRGTGTISSNLKTITWLYYVDDGSGEEDEVSATYTYMY
jgi:hypothetical protein